MKSIATISAVLSTAIFAWSNALSARAAAGEAARPRPAEAVANAGSPSPAQVAVTNSDWHGYQKQSFLLGGVPAYVVVPKTAAPGNPWIWRTSFPDYRPVVDLELVRRGCHIGYVEVLDLLGSDAALDLMDMFYAQVRSQWKLAEKPALEPCSRGGLPAYRYAARHPQRVACIYGDVPVMDFKSWPLKWPGGKPGEWPKIMKSYGFKTDAEAMAYTGNPIDQLAPIATARIPIRHVICLNDRVVPPEENTLEAKRRLQKLGWDMEVVSVKESNEADGHHFDYPDVPGSVRFILVHTAVLPASREYFQCNTFIKRLRHGEKITIATFGTSLTGGQWRWANTMQQWLDAEFPRQVTLRNFGVGASASSKGPGNVFANSGLDVVPRALKQVTPDVVFIEFATNDAYLPYSISLDDSRKNLNAMIDRVLAKNPQAEIILQTMNSCAGGPAKDRPHLDAYFDVYRQVAKQRGLLLVDHHRNWSRLQKEDPAEFSKLVPDGVHPRYPGYERIVLPELKRVLAGIEPPKLGDADFPAPSPSARHTQKVAAVKSGDDDLAHYNVVWNTPSEDSHGSMPLGNGDVGINAWVEPSGDLVFYVSKTDAWDENGRLCKIGRVRVKFDPPLDVAKSFRQELNLREGIVEIKCGQTKLALWVDANRPVARLEAESEIPVSCRAAVELWRLRERPFGGDDDSHSGGGLASSAFKPTVLPDVVSEADPSRVVWYHRNTRSIYGLTLNTQHLEALKDRFADPLWNFTFGACLGGPGFARDGKQAVKSAAAKRHELAVTVLTAQYDTADAWLAQLDALHRNVAKSRLAEAREAHEAWWRRFWDRSWVYVSGNEVLTRGYVLQRYMNACSGRGGSPIKFNGSIFTVEATPGAAPDTPAGDPDWRRWGGNYWFQNTRLAYWPMLAAGDFEMMDPWFQMYRRALPLSLARIKTYYGFDGAAEFPETMYFWGLPNNGDYGWNNQAPEPVNTYIRRYWNGGLELVAAMLDRYDYTQDEQFARETLVPLADPLISFLNRYWSKRDAQGKIRFEPAQSLETWHVAVNPLPEIAGLHYLLPRLLGLPASVTTAPQRGRWKKMLDALPPVPVATVNGVKLLRPAESFSAHSNSENTELYAVFPYRLYGIGRPGLEMARATYEHRGNRHNHGWCQDSIQAACLGLGDEAGRLVAARAAQVNRGYRFPAMWGPNFDWIPDQDHGNNILTTLQFMLLQSDGDKIYLLPAWPKGWNVSFKLRAAKNTVVRCVYRDGKIQSLDVAPPARRADVKYVRLSSLAD